MAVFFAHFECAISKSVRSMEEKESGTERVRMGVVIDSLSM